MRISAEKLIVTFIFIVLMTFLIVISWFVLTESLNIYGKIIGLTVCYVLAMKGMDLAELLFKRKKGD